MALLKNLTLWICRFCNNAEGKLENRIMFKQRTSRSQNNSDPDFKSRLNYFIGTKFSPNETQWNRSWLENPGIYFIYKT